MTPIRDFAEIMHEIGRRRMVSLYLSRPSCGVCGALKPKVIQVLAEFPEMLSYEVNLDDTPEAAGQLSVFTIPAVLVFADGRELIREARYISIPDLRVKIERPYRFIFASD